MSPELTLILDIAMHLESKRYKIVESVDAEDVNLLGEIGRLDLAILDHHPNFQLWDLADGIRKLFPDAKIYILSGITEIKRRCEERGYIFLKKPFDSSQFNQI